MSPSLDRLRWVAAAAIVLAAPVAGAQVRHPRELEYPKLPAFTVPKPQTFTLANGMRVFLLEDRELPLIEAVVRIRAGSNQDPASKVGLGALVGQLLREGGTTTKSPDAVDDFLAARAAEIETDMGSDSGSASMSCLAADFDEVFALLHDILRRPAFAEDRLAIAKAQTNAGIARRNDSIAGMAQREFQRLVYGKDSPLARIPEYATIGGITREDLVAFHRQAYHPGAIFLGLVGDFDAAAMRAKVTRQFQDWPAGPKVRPLAEPAYERASKPGVFFIEKEDVTQAYVRLGHLGIRVDSPDYFAGQVMNEILGGSFASRLFSNVRTTKGLAYSVSGGLGASYGHPGVFQVALSTKSSTMAQAVAALREEVRGIIDRPPTADELARAKASILNSFVFNFDSPAEILAQQMTYAYYGLPADFLDRYRSNIEKVTGADVTRVASAHVHPDQVKLLVVGRSADFDAPVATLGDVTLIDVRIPPPPE